MNNKPTPQIRKRLLDAALKLGGVKKRTASRSTTNSRPSVAGSRRKAIHRSAARRSPSGVNLSTSVLMGAVMPILPDRTDLVTWLLEQLEAKGGAA